MAFAYGDGTSPIADPTKGVYGYIAGVGAAWTTIPLYDAAGAAFVPTAAVPFGLKDVTVKNETSSTVQIQLRIGTRVFTSFYAIAQASLTLSFHGLVPVHDVLQVWSSGGPVNVSVDGGQP